MNHETKIILGLSAGAALVTGILPQLIIGLGAGYVVYRIHHASSVQELDRIMAFVDAKLTELDEHDRHRKTLEALREKIDAKKDAVRVGSSLIGVGTLLSPIVGVVYVAAFAVVKSRAQKRAMAAIDRQIECAMRPDAVLEEDAKEGDSLFLQALRATAHAAEHLTSGCGSFDPKKLMRARVRASA